MAFGCYYRTLLQTLGFGGTFLWKYLILLDHSILASSGYIWPRMLQGSQSDSGASLYLLSLFLLGFVRYSSHILALLTPISIWLYYRSIDIHFLVSYSKRLKYLVLTLIVMRYSFIATIALLYSVVLGPAFYYLWIYAGSGNANFFYAITLVWSLGLLVVIADSLYAVLREEWEVERPEMVGKDARQI